MRFKFFSIPVRDPEEASVALNRFLAAHRIAAVDRHLLADGANSTWAICITFDESDPAAPARVPLGKRDKVDYKELLTDPEFAVFARLRALRKDRSDAEGVPAYALFTNEQLAEMVQRRVTTAAGLREIPGIGEARVDKYGPAFLHILTEAALPEPTTAALEA